MAARTIKLTRDNGPDGSSRNLDFTLSATREDNGHRTWSHDAMQVAVLMDIRDELQKLKRLLHCQHFQQIPRTLSRMDRRLAQLDDAAKLRGGRPRKDP